MKTRNLFISLITLTILLVSACAPQAAPIVAESKTSSPDAIVKAYIETANTGDFDKAFAFYADEAIVQLPDGRTFTGKAEIAKWLEVDVKGTRSNPEDFNVSGDTVTVQGVVTLARFEPLGINPIEYELTVTVKNDKITSFMPKLKFTPEQQAKIEAATNPADRFAGTWSGTMSFTDDANRKEDIIVTIPAGCAVGSVCGDLNNTTVSCTWEMTLGAVNGDVFEYKFSKTMSGECPALGGGTLTMQSDGTLMREHQTPDFTASGVLTRK